MMRYLVASSVNVIQFAKLSFGISFLLLGLASIVAGFSAAFYQLYTGFLLIVGGSSILSMLWGLVLVVCIGFPASFGILGCAAIGTVGFYCVFGSRSVKKV